jgi:hypothetical protein
MSDERGIAGRLAVLEQRALLRPAHRRLASPAARATRTLADLASILGIRLRFGAILRDSRKRGEDE